MEFNEVAQAVAGIPFMAPHQGRLLFNHIRETQAKSVLELGTAHGVGAAYMAAALPHGGRVTTVDFAGSNFDPAPEDVLSRAGLSDRVEIVRRYSSYTWWLKTEIERSPTPRYDLVYLDGSKNWTIDGLAVLLAERLIRPGGWLVMDDLGWTYDSHPERESSDGVTVRSLSREERSQPHLRAVFDLIVVPHPAFSEMRIQDDWWGWARKVPGAPKTLRIEYQRSAGHVAMTLLRGLRRRITAKESTTDR
jgi:predicted O-methyltransferase YrrM